MEYFDNFDNGKHADYYISSEVKLPKLYEVFLIRDEKTPDDFISYIICDLFHKDSASANKMTNVINKKNRVSCGKYTRDVAETKQAFIMNLAHENSYPLVCVLKEGKRNVI